MWRKNKFYSWSWKKAPIVHSKDAAAKAVHDNSLLEEETHESRLNTIFQCGKVIRKIIIESEKQPWTFDGSLKNDSGAIVPLELKYLIRLIIQGTSHMATEAWEESTDGTCNIIGQHIVQEFKSDRQVNLSPRILQPYFVLLIILPWQLGYHCIAIIIIAGKMK